MLFVGDHELHDNGKEEGQDGASMESKWQCEEDVYSSPLIEMEGFRPILKCLVRTRAFAASKSSV